MPMRLTERLTVTCFVGCLVSIYGNQDSTLSMALPYDLLVSRSQMSLRHRVLMSAHVSVGIDMVSEWALIICKFKRLMTRCRRRVAMISGLLKQAAQY